MPRLISRLLYQSKPAGAIARPPPAAKPDTSAHVKSCSAYGAGYVNIPGTDTCVKVGGSVTVGGSVWR
jgi:Porin subfamily